jgi:multidrug efflux pump
MRIFMNQESIIADGSLMLRWQVISMVFVGFVLLMTIIFQSTGKVVGSFVLSISRQGVIFLLVLAAAYALAGYQGIIVSQAIADVITAAIAAVLFRCQVYQEMR